MVLNPCLPFPKSQDISCVSRWMAEYQGVIGKAESDLSIKIQGTALRAWGKKDQVCFSNIQVLEKLCLFWSG